MLQFNFIDDEKFLLTVGLILLLERSMRET